MPALLLLPILPLLAAAVILVGSPAKRRRRGAYGVLALASAFALAVAALAIVASRGPLTVRFYEAAASAGLALPLGFHVDRLGALMMVLVSGVAAIIYRYSLNYMYQDAGYGRFLALIGVTTSVLLCMVASANLVMLFVCWQLLSYLLALLAHNLAHPATAAGARKTFRFLRAGDAAFLAGIALAYSLYGTIEFETLFARVAATPITLSPFPGIEVSGATAVALLVFVGAMSKSAQFPVHVWLPHSLYAPTPVHALLHAGIINAGGFLLNRLAPLYAQSPTTLHVAFVVGLATAILGASLMLIQNDIKKTLGYSTIGQMGYMVMECGLGAFALAVFHLIAHGLFKASVFLNCGDVIHQARREPALPGGHGSAPGGGEFLRLTWATGFFTTLLMPLLVLLVAHGALRIPLFHHQGASIFLFFIWVTSSQAILTLTRLRFVASWKVSGAMLATLVVVVFTYLFAAERFTEFLYPDKDAVAAYFAAAALPGPIFDGLVGMTTLLVVLGWYYLYAQSRGERMPIPAWLQAARVRLYVLYFDQLYLDELYLRLGRALAGLPARAWRALAGGAS
ncbi:MAG: NADH-quinone oxidoreductase subunit L [Candidatus Sericytochromatia bacterium]|nr:NADH-quinone oxidoreductase subunit L [Candidatus Tanganyikabacteria bacterium]